MLVAIYDNDELLEHRECREVRLPTGVPGAIWRGLAYPLSNSGSIQIDGVAFSPTQCAEPLSNAISSTQNGHLSWAFIDGAEEAYVVLQGSVVAAESAAARLRDAGCEVRRHGRYLGEPVDGISADWFIRFVKPSSRDLPQLLQKALGGDRQSSENESDGTLGLRCQLLARELESVKANRALLHSNISRLTIKLAEVEGRSQTEIDQLLQALDEERHKRELAESSTSAAVVTTPEVAPPRAKQPSKLNDEVRSVMKALLPRIELMHDTMTFITTEMQTRTHLYRALSELNSTGDGMPASWKKLQGLQRWWERHVSTGQDDAGRIYARLDQATNRWLVLVSHKSDQNRDIAWLGRNS